MSLVYSDVIASRATILSQKDEAQAQALSAELHQELSYFLRRHELLSDLIRDESSDHKWAELDNGKMDMGLEIMFMVEIGRYYITDFNFQVTKDTFGCQVRTLFLKDGNEYAGRFDVACDGTLDQFVEAQNLDEMVKIAIDTAKAHNIALLADCGIVYVTDAIRKQLMAKSYPFTSI